MVESGGGTAEMGNSQPASCSMDEHLTWTDTMTLRRKRGDIFHSWAERHRPGSSGTA